MSEGKEVRKTQEKEKVGMERKENTGMEGTKGMWKRDTEELGEGAKE